MKHSIILSQSEIQQNVIVKRIPIKPQPYYIQSSGRWVYPIPKNKVHPCCCTEVCSASREWWEYLCKDQFPYQPGQVVYCRETWCRMIDVPCCYEYHHENGRHISPFEYGYKEGSKHPDPNIRWRSASTMPKEAARIWLKVVDIKAVFDGLWYWEVTMERTEAI